MSIVQQVTRVVPEPVKRPVRGMVHQALAVLEPWKAPFGVIHDGRGGSPLSSGAALARLALRPRRTVLCYPQSPSRHQIAYRLIHLLGYRLTDDPSTDYDVVLVFNPATVSQTVDLSPLKPVRTINHGVLDVSKTTVEAKFEEVFGYALSVNPEKFKGAAVRKSDANYTHDGEIVSCPYSPPPGEGGVTYQRYIDTRTPEGYFLDIRVPIYDGAIPITYRKYHPDTDRRFFDVDHSELADPSDTLSSEERRRLAELAEAIGLEYGEMDVLRDNSDGRIYVVDINPTPAGLVKGFTKEQRQQALRVLAPAFEQMVERRVALR